MTADSHRWCPSLPNTPPRLQYIGGKWVPAKSGLALDVVTPTTGKKYTSVARGDAADVKLALDAAHAAAGAWGRTPPAERAEVLVKVAAVIEENRELLGFCETVGNGKAIRESLNVPLMAAGASRSLVATTGGALRERSFLIQCCARSVLATC